MVMKLCESKVINKNPKYRIIQYGDSYYLVDLASNWLSYIFPMINWFIPKKCAEISKEEMEQLNIVKPVKNNAASWSVGLSICLSVVLRKYVHLLDVQFAQIINVSICIFIILSIILFQIYLNKKLTITEYQQNKQFKITLIPTIKNIFIVVFYYLFTGFFAIFMLSGLIIYNSQNVVVFLCAIVMPLLFSFINMFSINDTKVRVILKIKEVEK